MNAIQKALAWDALKTALTKQTAGKDARQAMELLGFLTAIEQIVMEKTEGERQEGQGVESI